MLVDYQPVFHSCEIFVDINWQVSKQKEKKERKLRFSSACRSTGMIISKNTLNE